MFFGILQSLRNLNVDPLKATGSACPFQLCQGLSLEALEPGLGFANVLLKVGQCTPFVFLKSGKRFAAGALESGVRLVKFVLDVALQLLKLSGDDRFVFIGCDGVGRRGVAGATRADRHDREYVLHAIGEPVHDHMTLWRIHRDLPGIGNGRYGV